MRLRGSVIGLGAIGRHHARIVENSERAELVGAVELNSADAGLDADRIFRSWNQLRARGEVDFAVVALPTALHEEASVAVANDGVHVLVEKPLALTEEGARCIVKACVSAGVHGAVAHVERYNPALVALKQMLQDGAIGRPVAIASERAGPLPVRTRETGVISDLATHDLDLIPWLVDSPIELVFAQTDSPGETEQVAAITGRLSSGLLFNTMADWLSERRIRRVRVLGEGGSLVADLLAPQLLLVTNLLREIPLKPVEPLASQFDSFCDLLESGSPAPVVSLDEGLRAVACADAAMRSARQGRPVVL